MYEGNSGLEAIFDGKTVMIDAIDPDPAESPIRSDVGARVHTGTPDYAALLTVPTALAFQAAI